MGKIVQTAGRDALGEFAPEFAQMKKLGDGVEIPVLAGYVSCRRRCGYWDT